MDIQTENNKRLEVLFKNSNDWLMACAMNISKDKEIAEELVSELYLYLADKPNPSLWYLTSFNLKYCYMFLQSRFINRVKYDGRNLPLYDNFDKIDEEYNTLPKNLNVPEFKIEIPEEKIIIDDKVYTVKQFENFFGQFTVTFSDNGNSSRGALSICSTSGSSVSVGTKSYFFGTASFHVAGISLSSTRVFVAFSHWNSTGQLYGIIGNVSGTTITSWGSTTEINSGENQNTKLQKINQNSIVILSRRVTSSESKVYLMTSASGTGVGIASNQTLTNTGINFSSNITQTKDNQVIIGLLGASSTGVISLLNLKDLVFNTSSITFKGLAKTGGTAGQTVEVFVNT
jgi:hypothetical protein